MFKDKGFWVSCCILAVAFLALVLPWNADAGSGAAQSKDIKTQILWADTAVSAGDLITSAVRISGADGYFAVAVSTASTCTGTLAVTYQLSPNGTDWYTPTTAVSIATGLTKNSGVSEDGREWVQFEPELAPWIQIQGKETGGTDTYTGTCYLIYR